MKIGGVDGCKAGWLLVKYDSGVYNLAIYPSFKELISKNKNLDRILIDIPIGLSSDSYSRTIESNMRAELGPRSSTVFNAPCRLAVYELDNDLARKYNIKIEKKSLSIQSLNIRKKIKEVDQYLIENDTETEVIESHPELCFKYLNEAVVRSVKSKSKGILERLKIMETFDREIVEFYYSRQKELKSQIAKKDDFVDAMCLCLVNKLAGADKLSFLSDENYQDEHGLMIRIGYYKN